MSNAKEIDYSDKYEDDVYEYRHVILPREKVKSLPSPLRLMSEMEWRAIGVQQSRGWEHYEIHKPEPHILLFRRPLGCDPLTGLVPPKLQPNSNPNPNSNPTENGGN
jgi:cyclin-dependent kinase regulatory subunit CKS1